MFTKTATKQQFDNRATRATAQLECGIQVWDALSQPSVLLFGIFFFPCQQEIGD